MSQITVNAKTQYPDNIFATFLFIASVTSGLGIVARVFFEGGGHEDQEIIAGSKFVQGINGEKIEKVIFINPSALSADIEYRFSTVFGYDEAKIIGDVNALVRFDNLSSAGNEYFAGNLLSAGVGLYAQTGFYNPVGSGVVSYINGLRLNADGVQCEFRKFVEADVGDFLIGFDVKNKDMAGAVGNTKIYFTNLESAKIGSDLSVGVSTDASKTPTAFDFGSSPIVLKEGYGIVFLPYNTNKTLSVFADISEAIA